MYTKILAAVNEHLNSEISARYALSLAKTCGAKLFLCFIAEKDLSRSSFDKAEDAMKRLFIEAEKRDIDAESITETGNPVREIEKIVRHEKINIVFASTRRVDVEKRFYAGTVARSLSLHLPCSVALVRVVHMGRVRPKNILLPLKAIINHVKERAYFNRQNLNKTRLLSAYHRQCLGCHEKMELEKGRKCTECHKEKKESPTEITQMKNQYVVKQNTEIIINVWKPK